LAIGPVGARFRGADYASEHGCFGQESYRNRLEADSVRRRSGGSAVGLLEGIATMIRRPENSIPRLSFLPGIVIAALGFPHRSACP